MKLRDYLTEGKIPTKIRKEIIDNIDADSKPKTIQIQDYEVKFKEWRKGKSVVYNKDFIDLTLLLVDICDTLGYEFTKKDAGKNTIFGIENK